MNRRKLKDVLGALRATVYEAELAVDMAPNGSDQAAAAVAAALQRVEDAARVAKEACR